MIHYLKQVDGVYILCPQVKFLATPPYDGAFREYIAMDLEPFRLNKALEMGATDVVNINEEAGLRLLFMVSPPLW